MAKAPKTAGDDLAADFEKLFGGNDEEATVTQFLSTGYAELDYALSSRWTDGGLPAGRVVEIAGPPASGKTAIATAVMSVAIGMGGIAGFMDHERSWSMKLAKATNPEFGGPRFVYKKPRTFEESLSLCVQVAKFLRDNKKIPEAAPIVWVFDSLASMVPMSVLFDKDGKERGLDTRNMNDNMALARATSSAMPAFSQYCEELGILAIFLNQVRTKIGVVYGDSRTTPGGDAPKFYASVRIMLNAASKITKKGSDAPLGMQISAAVIKNKISRPFLKADWRFEFLPDGTGKFAVARSTLELLIKTKVLKEVRSGFLELDGKQRTREEYAAIIEREGRMGELLALLPANYEPEVVAVSELEGGLEADDLRSAA